MEHNQIGNRIRELRMNRKMTQAELGNAVGVSMQAVSKWERGGTPDIEVLVSIARYFGVTMDELLGLVPDSSGELSDTLFSALLHSNSQNIVEEAVDYCWSVFKGISGLSSVQHLQFSDAPSAALDNSRCRVSNNDGISYFLAAKDARLFAIAPEPEGGFNAMLSKDSEYVDLFRFLSDPDAFRLLLYICTRPQSLFSRRLASQFTGVSESKVKKIFTEFEKRGWLVMENVDMDAGAITLYRTACKEHFIFFLLFAREMIVHSKVWYLTRVSTRTNPLLRSIDFPTDPSAGNTGRAREADRAPAASESSSEPSR